MSLSSTSTTTSRPVKVASESLRATGAWFSLALDHGDGERPGLLAAPPVADHVGHLDNAGRVAGGEGDVAPAGGAHRARGGALLLGPEQPEDVAVGVVGGRQHVVGDGPAGDDEGLLLVQDRFLVLAVGDDVDGGVEVERPPRPSEIV